MATADRKPVQLAPPAPKALAGRPADVRTALLLGPAFAAAIAYVDPGNFATDFAAGASDGYLLIWAVVVANAMAMVIQYLSARLGAATGKDLAELCRERYRPAVVWLLWVQAELMCMATDLAEFVGSALALRMLFGVPLVAGGLITGAVAFAVLALAPGGKRRFENVMAIALAVIFVAFAAQSFLVGVDTGQVTAGLVPRISDTGSLLLITGIVGATVMPHAIYVHSSLTTRLYFTPARRTAVLRAERTDVLTAMTVAGVCNVTMLAVGAALLHGVTGGSASLDTAYHVLGQVAAPAAVIFGIALLASGVAASGVGTYAGQIVMRGFLRVAPPITVRRLVTMVPALLVLGLGVDPTHALVLSQVVLSFGIPFALVPLVRLSRRSDVMGDFTASRRLAGVATAFAATIIALNCALLMLSR